MRDVDINPQPVDGGNVEQFAGRAPAASGINQRPDIRIARGNDSIERDVDLFKGLHFLQAFDVGLSRLHGRIARLVIPDRIVDVLLRHRLGLHQVLVPGRRNFSEVEVGLRP